jgi:hypothetical protein
VSRSGTPGGHPDLSTFQFLAFAENVTNEGCWSYLKQEWTTVSVDEEKKLDGEKGIRSDNRESDDAVIDTN